MPTQFGVLPNGDFKVDQKADIVKNLGCKLVRDAIVITDWLTDQTSKSFEAYTNAGLEVILNINQDHSDKGPVPFLKTIQLATYKQNVKNILTKYRPKVVVIENEPLNKNYHSGPMTDYVNMFNAAASVCHSMGIPVTDGGGYGAGMDGNVYRWLQAQRRMLDRDNFGNNAMTHSQVVCEQIPGRSQNFEQGVSDVKLILDAVKANGDYANLHLYEILNPNNAKPAAATDITPYVVQYTKQFVEAYTGKPAISNETGIRDNTQPALVSAICNNYNALGMPIVVYFSGDGKAANAKPLTNPDGTLNDCGKAFYSFVSTH